MEVAAHIALNRYSVEDAYKLDPYKKHTSNVQRNYEILQEIAYLIPKASRLMITLNIHKVINVLKKLKIFKKEKFNNITYNFLMKKFHF